MKKYLRSDFSKNVFRLMTGTTVSQLIPFITMPLLSRLFTPEEFGLYAFYFSLVTFLVVLSTGRYELAIPLPKQHAEAWQILLLSFLILFGFSILSFIVIIIFNSHFLALLNRPQLGSWLYLLPVFIFLTGSYNILTLWLHRMRAFGASANSKVQLSFWENLVTLIMGLRKSGVSLQNINEKLSALFSKSNVILSLNGIGFGGLLIGRLAGLIAASIYFIFKIKKSNSVVSKAIDLPILKKLAREHRNFPRINMPHAVSDELKNSGLSFTILYFFMDRVLGIYNQTYRLLRAPLGIIGSAFGHVFFQEVAELNYSNKPISGLIFRTLKKLFLIALPLFTLIFIFSPWFFTMFLGEKWSDVGVYAQYMTPWLFVNFIFSPVSQVALVIGKQFAFWMINLFSSILVFGSMIISGLVFNDIKSGLIIISVTQVFYSIYMYWWLQKIAKVHDAKNVQA
jgi:O-antigen/teichoic acid export membrane protein